MRYNIIILIVGLILLLSAALFDINYLNYRQPVPYSKWETISLYDFRGLKRPFRTLEGVSEFAYIETSREIHFLKENAIEITACFYPSRSYVFANDIRNPDLLRHELYHFHITEYVTRLFREEIANYSDKLTCSLIIDISEKYNEMEETLQREYDHDTYHSYVMNEQKKWERKLDEWLNSKRNFSMPIVYSKTKQ